MAVLPWGNSRNQTNINTEKAKASTLDWLSHSPTEPSRNALYQLMKQHNRGGSGGPVNVRGRSGASTPTSQHRSAASVDSRKEATTNVKSEKAPASRSRPATPVRPSTPGLERSDSASKSLFQKGGGLLRRKGSKMGMSFNTSSNNAVVSPTRPASSRAGFRGKDVPASPTSDDDRRPSISKPYDFAHVMHGDINAFTGLGRIDESDLALQFDAIQARYRNTTSLGEPLPQEPQALTPTKLVEPAQTTTALPQIPTITPPSTPSPKNSPVPVHPSCDVRSSRSTENFSRPNPKSPTSSVINVAPRPSSCHLQNLVRPPPSEKPDIVVAKPLPPLPTVIHAVSTEDDTARPLISAPLPNPPANTEKTAQKHQRQASSKSSLRHMSTFPSSRQLQSVSTAQDGQLLNIEEEDGLPRPHSDYELSQHAYRQQGGNRRSVIKKPLEVEDWEIAIDSAWDYEDDMDAGQEGSRLLRPVSTHSKKRESVLTIEQSVQDEGSSPSTPLMTMASTRRSQLGAELQKSTSAESGASSNHDKGNDVSLVGLGIDAADSVVTPPRDSQPPVLRVITTDMNRRSTSPRITRSAYSALSHSSSQESIILSIASSIMSTQRSSISSISVSEYAHAAKSDRSSIANSTNSPLLTLNVQKPARPESSCLPSALLQQMTPEAKVARPDSTCLPSVPSSNRNSAICKPNRPESVSLSKDMLATFPVPSSKARRASRTTSKHLDAEEECNEDDVSDLPSKSRTLSGSRTSVSGRVSINSISDGVPSPRPRSCASGSRARQSRKSYSLFPVAGPSTPTSIPDVDAVAS